MKVFISGISGTGMGPLALMAKAAGFEVFGTDLHRGAITEELEEAGIEMRIGEGAQDGEFLNEKIEEDGGEGVDWFVYTSALPRNHPELKAAREAGVKATKRDDFTAFLIEKLGLKLVAVAGTHGKTTTTAMLIFAAQKLGIPAAYVVGTTLGFAATGAYHEGDRYFIYEADEYDRNFLKFRPWLAVIPAVSYDHPDIYATEEDYQEAFREFVGQSRKVIYGEGAREGDLVMADDFRLAGEVRREDAALAARAILEMDEEITKEQIVKVLDEFPGVGRRFERIARGIYSDYAHHPEEIAATIEMAREEAERQGFSGVTVVYEPHQNARQHEVREGYRRAFLGADKVFWLPTFLTREEKGVPVLAPEELIAELENREVAEVAELDEELVEKIRKAREQGKLVVLFSAGPADGWLRGEFGG